MSLYSPLATSDTLNVLRNSTFSNKVDIRVHDSKLYVCKIEDSGAIFYGAELVLDTLPAAAMYGTQGILSAKKIASQVSLNLVFDSWTAQDEADFSAALLEGIGVQDAVVKILQLIDGSVQIRYEIIFASSVTDSDITAANTTLSTGQTLITKLQAKGGKFADPDNPLQITVIDLPQVTDAPVAPEIISLTLNADDTLGVKTIGSYHEILIKVDDGPETQLIDFSPPGDTYSVKALLKTVDGSVSHQLSLDVAPPPPPAGHYFVAAEIQDYDADANAYAVQINTGNYNEYNDLGTFLPFEYAKVSPNGGIANRDQTDGNGAWGVHESHGTSGGLDWGGMIPWKSIEDAGYTDTDTFFLMIRVNLTAGFLKATKFNHASTGGLGTYKISNGNYASKDTSWDANNLQGNFNGEGIYYMVVKYTADNTPGNAIIQEMVYNSNKELCSTVTSQALSISREIHGLQRTMFYTLVFETSYNNSGTNIGGEVTQVGVSDVEETLLELE